MHHIGTSHLHSDFIAQRKSEPTTPAISRLNFQLPLQALDISPHLPLQAVVVNGEQHLFVAGKHPGFLPGQEVPLQMAEFIPVLVFYDSGIWNLLRVAALIRQSWTSNKI